ncbi:MAG: baseplate J/gp47 family protein [Selenomonadaceae bacterium]|nr:baseplate J/gp47 family protein [Selenomonadaceae bacterium]
MTIPNISFVNLDVDALEVAAKKLAEDALGRTLYPSDPVLLLIKSLLAIIAHLYKLLDFCAKMNLLAFAKGEYLDCLGALVGVDRLPATYASCQVEVQLSAARQTSTTIKKGTRITADNQTFFSLDSELVFLAGEVSKETSATCLSLGAIGNGFAIGELNQIVDPQPFLLSISNTTTSDGGSDIEADDALRERIHIAPESFACAGPEGAYIARTKEVSALIADVAITSPSPGHVDAYLLMQGGALPSDQMLSLVNAHLSGKTVRPLNDIVTVKAPAQVSYALDATCYLANDERANAAQIIADAENAMEEFITWQSSKLGKDLNPSKLISLLMQAGVKRVQVNAPAFTALDNVSVAICTDKHLTFDYEDW